MSLVGKGSLKELMEGTDTKIGSKERSRNCPQMSSGRTLWKCCSHWLELFYCQEKKDRGGGEGRGEGGREGERKEGRKGGREERKEKENDSRNHKFYSEL